MAQAKPRRTFDKLLEFWASTFARLVTVTFPSNGFIREDKLEEIILDAVNVSANKLAGIPTSQTAERVEEDFSNRVQAAGEHLRLAGSILDALKINLDRQHQELVNVQAEIEQRKQDVEYWTKLAGINQETAAALRRELEQALQTQIRQELDRGKRIRLVMSFIFWVVTIVVSGIVGAAIQQYWQTGKLY